MYYLECIASGFVRDIDNISHGSMAISRKGAGVSRIGLAWGMGKATQMIRTRISLVSNAMMFQGSWQLPRAPLARRSITSKKTGTFLSERFEPSILRVQLLKSW